MLKGNASEERAYVQADELKSNIFRRVGVPSNQLVCPREKSDMTPCIARDGRLAVCFNSFGKALCVGCEWGVEGLHDKEKARA